MGMVKIVSIVDTKVSDFMMLCDKWFIKVRPMEDCDNSYIIEGSEENLEIIEVFADKIKFTK